MEKITQNNTQAASSSPSPAVTSRLTLLNTHFTIKPNTTATGTWSQGSEPEDKVLREASTDKIIFRWLKRDDWGKGFPSVLSGLTKGCEYSEV